jgi:hypothetical protein
MLEWGTWAAIVILGPGALAVFVWFLVDVRRLLTGELGDEERERE